MQKLYSRVSAAKETVTDLRSEGHPVHRAITVGLCPELLRTYVELTGFIKNRCANDSVDLVHGLLLTMRPEQVCFIGGYLTHEQC